MEGLIFVGIENILKVVAAIGVVYLIRFLSRRFSNEEMVIVKDIVLDGVLYAQQVYGHLNGDARYRAALDRIVKELDKKGIAVDTERLELFIEAAVKTLKVEFAERWPEVEDKEEG